MDAKTSNFPHYAAWRGANARYDGQANYKL
jgi:hypothetical protein